jgi:hypothetical protein
MEMARIETEVLESVLINFLTMILTKIKILGIAQQKRDEKHKLLQLKDAANRSQARE